MTDIQPTSSERSGNDSHAEEQTLSLEQKFNAIIDVAKILASFFDREYSNLGGYNAREMAHKSALTWIGADPDPNYITMQINGQHRNNFATYLSDRSVTNKDDQNFISEGATGLLDRAIERAWSKDGSPDVSSAMGEIINELMQKKRKSPLLPGDLTTVSLEERTR